MWIRDLHIDGFGLFHNHSVPGLTKGVLLFQGDNESGKTTLMEFVRTILFGFPRSGSRNDYPPLRGGDHGGRLRVQMQDGRDLIIERFGRRATIREAAGMGQPLEPSEALLGGLDRQTFERIFAIGLRDLETLDVLSGSDVRGRLLAASAGVGARSVPATIRTIEDVLDDLLKSRQARKPRINSLLRELENTRSEIRRLQDLAEQYAAKHHELERRMRIVQEREEKRESNAKRLLRIEQLERARDPWSQLHEYRERLEALQFAKDFPPSGLERFKQLRREIEGLDADRKRIEDEIADLETDLNAVDVDDVLLDRATAIEQLRSEREKLESALDDVPKVQEEVRQAESKLTRSLKELGPEWTPERLDAVDTSIQTREKVEEFSRRLDESRRRFDQAKIQCAAAQDSLADTKRVAEEREERLREFGDPPDEEELSRRRDVIPKLRAAMMEREKHEARRDREREDQAELDRRLRSRTKELEPLAEELDAFGEPPGEGTLKERRRKARRLRSELARCETLGVRLEEKRHAYEDIRDRLDAAEKETDSIGLAGFRWATVGGAVLALVAALIAVFMKVYPVAAALLVLGIAIAGTSRLVRRFLVRQSEERQERLRKQQERLRDRMKELEDEIKSLERQRDEARNSIEALADALGLESFPEQDELDAVDDEIDVGLARVSRYRFLLDAIGKLESEIKELDEQKEGRKKAIEEIETELKRIGDRIESLAAEAALDPPSALGDLDAIETSLTNAQDRLREWQEIKRKRDEAAPSLEKAKQTLERRQHEKEASRQTLDKAQEAWKRWLAERGFKESVRPEIFEAVLQVVENARSAKESAEKQKRRLEQIRDYVDEVRSKIAEVSGACGIELTDKDEIGTTEIDALVVALEEAQRQEQQRRQIEADLKRLRRELARLKEKIEEKRAQQNQLMEQAGTSDESEFYRRGEAHQEWRTCHDQIGNRERELKNIAGGLHGYEDLIEELDQTDPTMLFMERERLERAQKELASALHEENQAIGALRQELSEMVQNERMSDLLLKEQQLKEQLDASIRRWATHALCRSLLQEAVEIYEKERQPRVIKEASRFLETMTGTPYRLIMPTGEEKAVELEDERTLKRKNERMWSSGLADQVYLAIRFGLASEFAEVMEPLPLILDDVLVQFDPKRQLGAAKAILTMASEHQVLFFTCHPETVDRFDEAMEDSAFDVPVKRYLVHDGTVEERVG